MMNKILVFLNETPEVKIAVTVLIIIAVAVIIGLLLRSTRLWYWKTDKIIDSINDIGGRIDHMEEEMGDIFFAVVNLARWHKLDAEQCLITANRKFMKRFRKMEELATKPLTEYSFKEFDKLWKSAKNSSQEL